MMKTLFQRSAALLVVPGLLCFMLVGRAECADWVMVVENEEGVFYADRETAQKGQAPVREARELSVWKNHKEIQRELEVVEYDCAENKRRIVHTVTHDKNGAAGIRSTQNAPWGPVEQNQRALSLFKFSCRK